MKTSLLTPILLAATAAPQDPTPASVPVAGNWMIPIHSHADDPVGGAYGLWAAGPDYKVRFDDGMTYYPVLGSSYPTNLPLRWRTETVTAGGDDLVTADLAAQRAHSAWRYELRYGQLTEAYDVRRDGVEQTFTLHSRPATLGDVVVVGRLTTRLQRATLLQSAVGDLEFRDAGGTPIVRYGRAVAIDAAGRRADVTTSVAGDRVELRLAADFVACAAYPLVIDPLVGRLTVNTSPANDVEWLSVARDDVHNRVLFVYSRATAANDVDTWAILRNDDLSAIGLVFSDLSATWQTRHHSAAYVQGADRWLVAIERDFGSNTAVRVYFHDADDVAANSGVIRSIIAPAGHSDSLPSIGGHATAGDGRAYLAFQRDPAAFNTPDSRVHGAPIDASARTIGAIANLHTDAGITDYDAEYPCITQDAGGNGSWIVVWQEFNRANAMDDWDVLAQRVARDGTLAGSAALGHSGTANRHKLHPVVAGSDGRYLVSYLMRDNNSPFSSWTGNEIFVQRFNWGDAAPSPTTLPPQVAAADAANRFRASQGRGIAFDSNTDSHWVLAYRDTDNDVFAARFGYTGRTVESVTVYSHPSVAAANEAVCYNDDDYEFVIGYSVNDVTSAVLGDRLRYGGAANIVYGTGCRGSASASNAGPTGRPFAGSEFFRINLSGAAPSAPTALFVSTASAALPFSGACWLNLSPATMVQVAVSLTSNFGVLSVPFPLLDSVRSADLYWQFFQLDGGTLVSSTGLYTAIR